MTTLTTRRFPSRAALDAALGQRLGQAIGAHGASAIMLSGGTTPLPAYRALARGPLPHDRLHILFCDDRHVPCDSDASNYHQARPLLDALALPPGAVARVRTELPLQEAAADYERQLAALLDSGVRIGLGLLGLGADGQDRKSTRLNSSHLVISYAVFCLKKKKKTQKCVAYSLHTHTKAARHLSHRRAR